MTYRVDPSQEITVLLVEDNPGDQRLIQEQLREVDRLRFATIVVGSLKEALHEANRQTIDAILLDLNLPDSHGLETIDTLITEALDVPTVVLTGIADEEIGIAAIQHGASDYLTKDQIGPEMLRRAVVYAVQRHLSQRNYQRMAEIHRQTLASISDAVFITDDAGRFTYVCPNTHHIFGYGEDEVREMGRIDRLLGPEILDHIPPSKDTEIANVEHATRDKNGEHRDLLVNVKAVDIGEGTTLITCRDVTERMRAERELEAERQRLQAIFDNALDAIVLTDNETRYVDVNPAACDLLGYPRSELIGRSFLEFVPVERRAEVESIMAELYRGQQRGEYRLARPDGSQRDTEFLTSGNILPGLHLTIMRDITPRKMAERELAESQRFTQSIIDSLDANIAVLDEKGFIISTNAQWDQYSQDNGVSDPSRTGVGVNYLNVCRHAQGDDAEEALQALTGIQDVLAGEASSFDLEYPCPEPDHPDRWFLLHAAPFTGPQQGVVVAHLDVTERKRAEDALLASEREYRRLFELNLAGVFKSTPEGQLLTCNHALVEMLGYDSRAELQEVPTPALYADPSERDRLAQALLDHGELTHVEVQLCRKDGHTIHSLMHSKRVTENGHAEFHGTVIDITERKRAEAERAQLINGLERVHEELRRAYDETIAGWAKALELKDKETEGHTRRVADYTLKLARRFDFDDKDLSHIHRGALLHDIGKMGVPDAILHKPGKLDDDEWEVMKQHPVHAYELLKAIDFLRPSLAIPHCHHERWDGAGYPQGLAGDQIPLEARIFAVVDAYDAMTNDRPYRDGLPHDEAIRRLQENAGTQFDPDVVEAFVAMIDDGGAGA